MIQAELLPPGTVRSALKHAAAVRRRQFHMRPAGAVAQDLLDEMQIKVQESGYAPDRTGSTAKKDAWRGRMLASISAEAMKATMPGAAWPVLQLVALKILGYEDFRMALVLPRTISMALQMPRSTVRDALRVLEDRRLVDLDREGGKVVRIRISSRFFKSVDKSADSVDNSSLFCADRRKSVRVGASAFPPATPQPSSTASTSPLPPEQPCGDAARPTPRAERRMLLLDDSRPRMSARDFMAKPHHRGAPETQLRPRQQSGGFIGAEPTASRPAFLRSAVQDNGEQRGRAPPWEIPTKAGHLTGAHAPLPRRQSGPARARGAPMIAIRLIDPDTCQTFMVRKFDHVTFAVHEFGAEAAEVLAFNISQRGFMSRLGGEKAADRIDVLQNAANHILGPDKHQALAKLLLGWAAQHPDGEFEVSVS